MTGYITFEGRITPLEWDSATYTIRRLLPHVVAALGKTRRVEGEINDHPINLALTRAPVCPDVSLWTEQSLLGRAGILPGDLVEVRLLPSSADAVETTDDVMAALRTGEVCQQWANLTPGKQRRLLYQIGAASTSTTRAKRIASLFATLKGPA